MITCLEDERIAQALLLRQVEHRNRAKRFLVSGIRLVEETLKTTARPEMVFHTASLDRSKNGRALLAELERFSVEHHLVSPDVMQALGAQGVLAVSPLPRVPALSCPALVLIADRVRKAHDLATILRSAAAAGVDQVWVAPWSIDAYDFDVVRQAMGVHLRLSIRKMSWKAIYRAAAEMLVLLAGGQKNTPYNEIVWRWPVALIITGKAGDPSAKAQALAHVSITTPLTSDQAPLNVAMAAGVVLFEVAQRKPHPSS